MQIIAFLFCSNPTDPPGDSTNTGDITALLGWNVTLSCECDDLGYPPGVFKWRTPNGEKDGQILTLENLDINTDEGLYECWVENFVSSGLPSSQTLTINCTLSLFYYKLIYQHKAAESIYYNMRSNICINNIMYQHPAL